MKDCKENQIRNPETGRCVLKTSPKGKQILKAKGSDSRRTSPRRVSSSPRRASPRRASPRHESPKKQKACRSDQVRNPDTGRCVLRTSPKGKQILKKMGSSSRRVSSLPRRASPRRVSSSPRRASPPRRNSPKKQKPCRTEQVRNPKTGRCVLKSSPKGKEIMKAKGSASKRASSPIRASVPRRASSSSRHSSSRPRDMDGMDELPDMRFRDILRPVGGEAGVSVADFLSSKDLHNLAAVNKAMRDSAIYDIRQRRDVYSLDDKKSKEYINNKASQDSMNNILKKYNQKLGLVIKNQTDYENFLRIKDIENNIESLDLEIEKLSLENLEPLEKLKNLQSLNLITRLITRNTERFVANLNLKNLKLNNIDIISIDKLLKMMKKCENLWCYEYYDGLQIRIDGFFYLIPDDGEYFSEYQDKIFEKIQSLDNLISFDYTSRFSGETEYTDLFVNENLRRLKISHMNGINSRSQLGNIKELEIREFISGDIEKLPKSLEKIEISSLFVETEDEYNEVIKYFEDNNIKYYIDDCADYRPAEE